MDLEPVRIFIGTDPRMWRGEAVLRYSIEKHISGPVEIVSMNATNGDVFWQGWEMGRPLGQPATRETTSTGDAVWFTDFTNFRWAIPEACGFSGKAIYIDVDEIFLRDPRGLWDLAIPQGRGILTLQPSETSVMLIDCASFRDLDWWPSVKEMRTDGWGIRRYVELLHSHNVFAPLPAYWNCLDGKEFVEGTSSLIHYTDMATQPWCPYPERLPYGRHPEPVAENKWMELFYEAYEKSAFPESPPPGGQCPAGVEDIFPAFLEKYESEQKWLKTIDTGSTAPTLEACQYSHATPSPRYQDSIDLHREMHLKGSSQDGIPDNEMFAGQSLKPHVENIKQLIDQSKSSSILDYGSGKGYLYRQDTNMTLRDGKTVVNVPRFWGLTPTCYDPAYPPYSERPETSYDGVINTDCLEHCPEEDLPWIIGDLFNYARKFVFANIAVYPAVKTLPNGENAHITIRSNKWWSQLIESVATRYPNTAYFFLITTRYPLQSDPDTYGSKIELIEGPPHHIRVLQ